MVLLWAAVHTWNEQYGSTRWQQPLWVGIFPVNADGTPAAQSYVDGLDTANFADIEDFMAREAHRYGRPLAEPVHIVVYPQVRALPPELGREAGLLGTSCGVSSFGGMRGVMLIPMDMRRHGFGCLCFITILLRCRPCRIRMGCRRG